MKYLLSYQMSPAATPERIRALYDAHCATWREYQAAGTLLAVGPMENSADGALSIFATEEAAREFASRDPFVTEGVVGSWTVTAWREVIWEPKA